MNDSVGDTVELVVWVGVWDRVDVPNSLTVSVGVNVCVAECEGLVVSVGLKVCETD